MSSIEAQMWFVEFAFRPWLTGMQGRHLAFLQCRMRLVPPRIDDGDKTRIDFIQLK